MVMSDWGTGQRTCPHVLGDNFFRKTDLLIPRAPRLFIPHPSSLIPHPSSLIPHPSKGLVASYAIRLPVRKHGRYEIVYLPAKRY